MTVLIAILAAIGAVVVLDVVLIFALVTAREVGRLTRERRLAKAQHQQLLRDTGLL